MPDPVATPPANQAPAGTTPAGVTPPAVSAPAGTPPANPPAVPAPALGADGKPVVATPPPAPVAIQVKLDDKALLDADGIADVVKFATEKGLSQAQAQALAERENVLVRDMLDDHRALVEEQRAAWKAEITADKEFGGEKLAASSEAAKRVIARFGLGEDSKTFSAILDSTGLGNHPAVLRTLARIGMAMREDAPPGTAVIPPKAEPKTFAQALYPDQPKA